MSQLQQAQIDLLTSQIADLEKNLLALDLSDKKNRLDISALYNTISDRMLILAGSGYLDSICSLLESLKKDLPIADLFLMALAFEYKDRHVALSHYHGLKAALPKFVEYWAVFYLSYMHQENVKIIDSEEPASASNPETAGSDED